MPPDHPATAVVGGGLLGLAVARRLAQAGTRVTLFERAEALGGLASAWSLGPVTWDRFYHVILQSDAHTHALLTDLGLADAYVGRTTRTGFYTDGRHHPFTTPLDFARFPPLNLIDKARLAATILYASRLKNWRKLESVTAADWLTKLSGRRTAELIWKPLLRAKLGDAAGRVNAAFIWATIARMYAARRSGMKVETFGTVPGGYATILARFADHLAGLGVEVRTGARVESVTAVAGGVAVAADGGAEHFDTAVVTAPAPVAAGLIVGLTPGECERLRGLEYQGVVCASLLMRPAARRLLRHQRHRPDAVHRGDRADRAGAAVGTGRAPPGVPAEVRRRGRRDLGRAGRRGAGPLRRRRAADVPALRPGGHRGGARGAGAARVRGADARPLGSRAAVSRPRCRA